MVKCKGECRSQRGPHSRLPSRGCSLGSALPVCALWAARGIAALTLPCVAAQRCRPRDAKAQCSLWGADFVVQCRNRSNPAQPRDVRETQGAVARVISERALGGAPGVVGVLASASGFTQQSRSECHRASVPLALLHVELGPGEDCEMLGWDHNDAFRASAPSFAVGFRFCASRRRELPVLVRRE
jgi:hypothetical protein